MNYATIKTRDIANGPGVRVSLFVSGCTHHCKNCFNKETWDFKYGDEFDENAEKKILDTLKDDFITGFTVLGGEPFESENQKDVLQIIKKVRKAFPEKTIWCYTGYLIDDILSGKVGDKSVTDEIFENIDILVDGEFVEDLKNPGLQFRGSSNQRVIDVKKTLSEGEIHIWDELSDFVK